MTSLSQYYHKKDQNGSGITTKKTFMVPLDELYTVPGEQGRPLNEAHAQKMAMLWMDGVYLPALSVEVTERGVKVVDGQHRYMGAIYAREKGKNILRIECQDFEGTELEKLAFQTNSSEGLQITPLERAINYSKAKKCGYTIPEIAAAFHRSITDVENYLELLTSGPEMLKLVESGQVMATTAVAMSKEYGPAAGRVATEELEKAKAQGKTRLTKSAALKQFSPKKSRRLVELLAQFEFTDDSYKAPDEIYLEVMSILKEYREKFGTAQVDDEVAE